MTSHSAGEAIAQDWALRLQLAAIAGNEPATSHFEIRSKRATGRGMNQDWIPVRELDRTARSAINRGQMTDTYIGAAPRAQRKGGASAIERVWCLWADCDGPESLRRLAAFAPLPSIVIRSGGDDRCHAYWPLRKPTSGEWAQRANRRLALALGGDSASTDPARVLRPAGTFNHKHDPARPVVCTRLELDVFTCDQIVAHLSDDRDYVPPPRPPRDLRKVDFSKLLDGLARKVHEAAVGNRNAALFWAGCRVREHADLDRLDETEARQVLRDAALTAGLGEYETDRTLDSALDTRAAA
jgi:hypothetical protein